MINNNQAITRLSFQECNSHTSSNLFRSIKNHRSNSLPPRYPPVRYPTPHRSSLANLPSRKRARLHILLCPSSRVLMSVQHLFYFSRFLRSALGANPASPRPTRLNRTITFRCHRPSSTSTHFPLLTVPLSYLIQELLFDHSLPQRLQTI